MERRPELDPGALPPGMQVGPWEVMGWRGRGTYGTVYRVQRTGQAGAKPVALKLALYPEDPRFEREAELLSRIHHPHVPCLLEHGAWRHPSGASYPYLAMEWVDGEPLYEWAQMYGLTSRQALRVLAQLARALEATHAAGGVHRDVKGGNVLVRPVEGWAFLMDFGAGTWAGASPLTEEPMPPGTRLYRPPEALRFQWEHRQSRTEHYAATAADDVYSLGVTAYRLVTGVYPPPATEPAAREDAGRATTPTRWPARALQARVVPELDALIERMLAEDPEARGSAAEMAQALEEAAERAGPEADLSLTQTGWAPARVMPVPVPALPAQGSVPVAPVRTRMSWRWPFLVAAVAGGVLALDAWWRAPVPPDEVVAQVEVPDEALEDAGTVGLAHAAITAPMPFVQFEPGREGIALDMPQRPLPGQLKPDAYGRCPGKRHVAIYGGCWRALDGDADDCDEDGYVYKDKCYAPVFPATRPSTSAQPWDAGSY